MKISLKWINDYIDVQEYLTRPEALAEILTQAGLEVEDIQNPAKDFNFVVVGQILEKGQHPNADKLSLCQVTTGEGVVHQIVCGAKNHKQGDKIVVALPGAVLPGNFAIKQSAIRGVESGGMLCSLKELGMAGESEGLYILPENAPVGKTFAEFMGLDDVIFELKVTPNRADCLSHYGLARELSALLEKSLKPVSYELKKESTESSKKYIDLQVKNAELCPRYTGRVIRNVKVGASPLWLKNRLELVGLKSINNVVDITNYMMMEMGQPMHAFDLRTLEGGKVIVDVAQKLEKFKTLDGTELTLTGEELMIRDGAKAVALAGVVGGQNSGIQNDTQDIFLECAYFAPQCVRKSSRKHGITTDSAYRFSRGVDPTHTLNVMNRAAQMIVELTGGEALGESFDFYPQPIETHSIQITPQFISDCLGYTCEPGKLDSFLLRLGCKIEKTLEQWKVTPPLYRFDLEHDMDLVEEYARLNGYKHIPETLPVNATMPASHDLSFVLHRHVNEIMMEMGFSEARNYAFTSDKKQKEFVGSVANIKLTGLKMADEPVSLVNPLNEELNVMRTTLLSSLFENMRSNYHYGNEWGRLFETGFTFEKLDDNYKQYSRISGMAWGHPTQLWNKETYPLIYEIKGVLEALFKKLNITSYNFLMTSNRGEVPSFVHRGQFAVVQVEGKKMGFIGTLHPVLMEEHKIRTETAVFELDLDILLERQPRSFRTASISKMPMVERDLALLMPLSLEIGKVQNVIQKSAGGWLQSLEVFDVYKGEKLETGKKSVAIRLKLQDLEKTLSEQQIQELMTKVMADLQNQLQVGVR